MNILIFPKARSGYGELTVRQLRHFYDVRASNFSSFTLPRSLGSQLATTTNYSTSSSDIGYTGRWNDHGNIDLNSDHYS